MLPGLEHEWPEVRNKVTGPQFIVLMHWWSLCQVWKDLQQTWETNIVNIGVPCHLATHNADSLAHVLLVTHPTCIFAHRVLWRWDTLHPGLAWLLEINRAACASELWAREATPAWGKGGWSYWTIYQGASVAWHADPQQSEWGFSLLSPSACVWRCAGWHGAGPLGAFRTPALTENASKTQMNPAPCEHEGKDGTVHPGCRNERRRVCGESKTTHSACTGS